MVEQVIIYYLGNEHNGTSYNLFVQLLPLFLEKPYYVGLNKNVLHCSIWCYYTNSCKKIVFIEKKRTFLSKKKRINQIFNLMLWII